MSTIEDILLENDIKWMKILKKKIKDERKKEREIVEKEKIEEFVIERYLSDMEHEGDMIADIIDLERKKVSREIIERIDKIYHSSKDSCRSYNCNWSNNLGNELYELRKKYLNEKG